MLEISPEEALALREAAAHDRRQAGMVYEQRDKLGYQGARLAALLRRADVYGNLAIGIGDPIDLLEFRQAQDEAQATQVYTPESVVDQLALGKQLDRLRNLYRACGLIDEENCQRYSVLSHRRMEEDQKIDRQLRTMPSSDELKSALSDKRREVICQKAAQGFCRLVVVPYAIHLGTFLAKTEQAVAELQQTGTVPNDHLFDLSSAIALNPYERHFQETKGQPEPKHAYAHQIAKTEFIEIPLLAYDVDGQLVYQPIDLKPGAQGKTQKDLAAQALVGERWQGWGMYLIEDYLNPPRSGLDVEVGGRRRPGVARSLVTAVQDLQRPTYAHEQPMDLRIYLAAQLARLAENGVPFDTKRPSLLPGNYIPTENLVPSAAWNSESGALSISFMTPDHASPVAAVRTAIKLLG